MKRLLSTLAVGAFLFPTPGLADEGASSPDTAAAQEQIPDASSPADVPEVNSLQLLLDQVKQGWEVENATNKSREREFLQKKSEQQRLLAEAKERYRKEEARSDRLEKSYEDYDVKIAQSEETLKERMGNLGELFGVVRQVAGDTRGNVAGSLVSAQVPNREPFLLELGKSKALPEIGALEKLWFDLQQEMTEQGRIVRFKATVVTTEGNEIPKDVIRIGAFNAVSNGKYLYWDPEVMKLKELGRQPGARYLQTVREFEKAKPETISALALDPSRGAILGLLVMTPGFSERIDQGGPIGYAIIVLGVAAGILGIIRFVYVALVSRKVASQQKSQALDEGNPLGRVLSVYESNKETDPETLELKLDEAILRESSMLERFLWIVKVVSVVAPLMGLLGTVTGMIATFQAITLFGTGDPKLMAGGISEALVTTMLGLFVAIPLTLIHAGVASFSRGVMDILEEQSAGFVATRAETARVV